MDQDRTASVPTRIATERGRSSTVGLWYQGDEIVEEVDENADGAIRQNESNWQIPTRSS